MIHEIHYGAVQKERPLFFGFFTPPSRCPLLSNSLDPSSREVQKPWPGSRKNRKNLKKKKKRADEWAFYEESRDSLKKINLRFSLNFVCVRCGRHKNCTTLFPPLSAFVMFFRTISPNFLEDVLFERLLYIKIINFTFYVTNS